MTVSPPISGIPSGTGVVGGGSSRPSSSRLVDLAFALLARRAATAMANCESRPEAQWLRQRQGQEAVAADSRAWSRWCEDPPESDEPFRRLCTRLRLRCVECLAVALAAEVELDSMAGRVLAWLQAPLAGARPTAGLAASLAAELTCDPEPLQLAHLHGGQGLASGLLQGDGDSPPLADMPLRVPVALALALRGLPSQWPGVTLGMADPPLLPASIHEKARVYARALGATDQSLAICSGHPSDAIAAAIAVADALASQAACFRDSPAIGLGPWLTLMGAVPVLCETLAPGERGCLPALPGYQGPILVASGVDGSFVRGGHPVPSWRLKVPPPAERQALWRSLTADEPLAEQLGERLRQGPAGIQALARAARLEAGMAEAPRLSATHVMRASRLGTAADLGSLAELLPEPITDQSLVVSPVVASQLEALSARCRYRDRLVANLGPATQARYRPGVRALLHGPSGTGKSLAVGWLATRIGLPLYRVDLASVTSKYIGETEKNLALLFARAEQAEVVLLFDEADSLFGKRTEGRDANGRFANGQTNYLLQRIESFEGIALLTSNTRARFDSAFTRRLDMIIEFPVPTAEERRYLWLAHLGDHHGIDATELNRLATSCDLAGGHIRNAVLAAAARTCQRGGAIRAEDVRQAIAAEYRKLGKPPPQRLSELETP
jgi:hypothetical protein